MGEDGHEQQSNGEGKSGSDLVALSIAAVGAYLVSYLFYDIVVDASDELQGLSGAQAAELFHLGTLGGIYAEVSLETGGGIFGGETSDSANLLFVDGFLVLVVPIAGIPLFLAGYLVTRRFSERSPAAPYRSHLRDGAALSIPYGVFVGWRASAFGDQTFTTDVEDGGAFFGETAHWEVSGEPLYALVGALIVAGLFGGLGSAVAAWRAR